MNDNGFLSEAIHSIGNMAVDSRSPEKIAETETETIWHSLTAGMFRTPRTMPPRTHVCDTVGGFCDAVNRWNGIDSSPAIFVGEDRAIAVIDDDVRRTSTVTLPIMLSTAFTFLAKEAVRPSALQSLGQLAFVRTLQTKLRGIEWGVALIEAAQSIRFVRNEEGTSDITSGKGHSLGKAVQAKVSSLASPLPDEMVATCNPLMIAPELTVDITCSLFVDHNAGTFSIDVCPDSIIREMLRIRQYVVSEIRLGMQDENGETDATVILGTP